MLIPEILGNVFQAFHVTLAEIEQQNELLDGFQLLEVDHLLHFALGPRRYGRILHLDLDHVYQFLRGPGARLQGEEGHHGVHALLVELKNDIVLNLVTTGNINR